MFEKLLIKLSKDASQKPSCNQMSLPIQQGHQTPSAQFRKWLMGVTGLAWMKLGVLFGLLLQFLTRLLVYDFIRLKNIIGD